MAPITGSMALGAGVMSHPGQPLSARATRIALRIATAWRLR